MVTIFVAKMPGSANKMAACAKRGCTPGNIFSRGPKKQKITASTQVKMVAKVVMRNPPRQTP